MYYKSQTTGDEHTFIKSGDTLTGAVSGTIQWNGDIIWEHGYTSRKNGSDGEKACSGEKDRSPYQLY